MPCKPLPGKVNSARRVGMALAPSKAGLTAAAGPVTLAGMTPYEAASLDASYIGLGIAAGNMLAAIVAAAGIWVFGLAMKRANERRAETEKDRHEQIMASFKDAAEDRKAALAEAAEDRKVTQGMLAALTELVRRTSPPSSQAGPQPGPAE